MLISKFCTDDIEHCVQKFEREYKFMFPEEYKRFLLRYNGGKTPESSFKLNKIYSNIDGFYGLGQAEMYFHYDIFAKGGKLIEYINDEVIPIATNCFGDYIVIGIGRSNNGKIYFYYHDRPKKYIELIDSFIAFVSKCKSKRIRPAKSIEERREILIAKGKGANIDDELIKIWQAEIDEYANICQEELVLD